MEQCIKYISTDCCGCGQQVNILLLTDSDAFAGTEQHMLTLAVALQSQGVMVYVGCPSGSPLAGRCCDVAITTANIEKNGAIDYKAVLDLVRFAKQNRINIVHVHNGRTAIIARLAKLVCPNLKLVFTQHFLAPTHTARTGLKRIVSDLVHRFIACGLVHIICVSNSTRNELLQRRGPYSRCNSTVIHNGIDINKCMPDIKIDFDKVKAELRIPNQTGIVLIASRLEPEKEVVIGLTAFAALVADGYKLILLIAGQGSQLGDLKMLATNLGIAESVRFVGFRSDIPVLMSVADIFVFTSPIDSFGMSILEAMAMKTPVVAANAGGPTEIIKDGLTGFLYNAGDALDLKRKISDCIMCPHLDEVTSHAWRDVEIDFSVNTMVDKTIKVYERALNRGIS